MKIAVRYQSRGGNTKSVAEAIANKAGVKAEPITVPLDESVDFLFVGGGVYALGLDDSLKNYLKNLDPEKVRVVAAFSTAGALDETKKINSIVQEKGISVASESLSIKLGVRNYGSFSKKGFIDLNDKQLSSINNFVEKVIA